MKIDHDEVRRIGRLARLDLSDVEVDLFAVDLTAIVTFVGQLEHAPIAGALETPAGMALREDTVAASLGIETVAANAPAWRDGYFVVPRVVARD